ncbi:MAG: prolipoprotein diacylglyceryl transferase [Gammaproteobacteria bacterium]
MLKYPTINPVALQLGPLAIHWYGLMYLFGIAAAFWLLHRRIHGRVSGWTDDQVLDMTFYAALGVIVGGRIGYVLLYNLPYYLADPIRIFEVWDGGMSFHGGMLGVIAAMMIYGHRTGRNVFDLTDFIAPVVPLGLLAGRAGNFINGELWGEVSHLPWAMRLPCANPRFFFYCGYVGPGWSAPHVPSQLYELALEGIVLFVVLFWFSAKARPRMAVSGLFALLYGIFRTSVEFVRLPDPQLGYLAFGWLTMGQVLSIPMIAAGILLLYLAYRHEPMDSPVV